VAALRRLAAVAVANGALLSFFALVQFFTAPHNVVYWTFPTGGEVFGPFICRNHFPFYVNVCVGLGVGLLLARRRPGGRSAWDPLEAATELLHAPHLLWVGIPLALMIGATALSLSRGGFLALLGAGAVCLALLRWQAPRPSWLVPASLIAALA